MSDEAATVRNVSDSVRDNWGWFLALGVAFILGGVFAFAAPFVASLAVTIVIAAVLVLAGIVQLVQAWRTQSWGGYLWQLIIGAVLVVGGVAVYLNPVVGTLALTLVVAAMFIAKGIFQVVLALRLRPHDGWGWILGAGVLAALVGLIIWFDYPFSGTYALGILVGISLALTGWSYVMIALAGRRLGGG